MIDILMAVYNGEKYISEQIESLLRQSCVDWRLLVSDDCSEDETVKIIKRYMEMYPNKITLYENKTNTGSAGKNFLGLLEKSSGEYVMFCDQDDVWKNDKIAATIDKMWAMEQEYGDDMPILVHTDLEVVNENLSLVNKSMFEMQKLDYNRTSLNELVVQNIVTGCTVMINRALINRLEIMPEKIAVHDWWLGVMASIYGKIGFVEKATILYRQHGENSCGAQDMYSSQYIRRRAGDAGKARKMLRLGYWQAEEIAEKYRDSLNESDYRLLRDYGSMDKSNKLKKIYILLKHNIWKAGTARKIGQIIYM